VFLQPVKKPFRGLAHAARASAARGTDRASRQRAHLVGRSRANASGTLVVGQWWPARTLLIRSYSRARPRLRLASWVVPVTHRFGRRTPRARPRDGRAHLPTRAVELVTSEWPSGGPPEGGRLIERTTSASAPRTPRVGDTTRAPRAITSGSRCERRGQTPSRPVACGRRLAVHRRTARGAHLRLTQARARRARCARDARRSPRSPVVPGQLRDNAPAYSCRRRTSLPGGTPRFSDR